MPPILKEAKIILALEAIQNNNKLSLRAVAKLYEILFSTLCDRHAGRPA